MHRKGSDSSLADEHTADPATRQPATETGIMGLLLSGGHAGIWTRSELELESSATPIDVQDALVALRTGGLIHLHGELVTPTRAAQRMDELEL